MCTLFLPIQAPLWSDGGARGVPVLSPFLDVQAAGFCTTNVLQSLRSWLYSDGLSWRACFAIGGFTCDERLGGTPLGQCATQDPRLVSMS